LTTDLAGYQFGSFLAVQFLAQSSKKPSLALLPIVGAETPIKRAETRCPLLRQRFGDMPLVGTGADVANFTNDVHPVITFKWR